MGQNKFVKSAAPVLNLFKRAGVDVHGLEEAISHRNPQDLTNERNSALAKVASANLSRKEQQEFLKSLADISSDFLNKMNEAHLYDAKINNDDAKITNDKVESLRRFMAYICNTQQVKQVHLDLDRALRKFYKQSANETQDRADRLKKCMGTHDITANDELKDLSSNSVEAKRSNAMYDAIRLIGHLLSSRAYRNYMAKIDNALYPELEYPHVVVAPKDEPFRKQMQKQWKMDSAPGTPAMTTPIPGPVRGPGM